jgi:phage shock protein PspC (stress-responsive transcriptional regulator)
VSIFVTGVSIIAYIVMAIVVPLESSEVTKPEGEIK